MVWAATASLHPTDTVPAAASLYAASSEKNPRLLLVPALGSIGTYSPEVPFTRTSPDEWRKHRSSPWSAACWLMPTTFART